MQNLFFKPFFPPLNLQTHTFHQPGIHMIVTDPVPIFPHNNRELHLLTQVHLIQDQGARNLRIVQQACPDLLWLGIPAVKLAVQVKTDVQGLILKER